MAQQLNRQRGTRRDYREFESRPTRPSGAQLTPTRQPSGVAEHLSDLENSVAAGDAENDRARAVLEQNRPVLPAATDDSGAKKSELPKSTERPYDKRTPAEREANPGSIPYNSQGTQTGKKKNNLKMALATLGILGIFGGGAAFYGALTGLPRDLVEQAAHVVRQRIGKYANTRVQTYLYKFLSKSVFGNNIAIQDCANDHDPAPIITKDCFYRHRQEYPKTILGRVWQGWWDGRVAKRMVQAGVNIDYDPPSAGKPAKWVLSITDGTKYEVGIDDPDGLVKRLEFEARTRGDLRKITSEIAKTIDIVSHAGPIARLEGKLFRKRQFGLNGCMFYCFGNKRPLEGQSTLAVFKNRLLANVAVKVVGANRLGLAWACFLSRQYNCSDSDSDFRQKYAEEIKKAGDRVDSVAKIDQALKVADIAKNTGRGLIETLVREIVTKIAGRTASDVLLSPVPIIGQIFDAVAIAGIVLMVYNIYDALSGPVGQMWHTKTLDEAFIGAADVVSVAADEPNAVPSVYDSRAQDAVSSLLAGSDQSLPYQSLYGNVQGLKNYQALFSGSRAEAETTDPNQYPNKCSDDGLMRPEGHLVCPNWQYDYKPPVLSAAQKVGLPPGAGKGALDNIASVANDVVDIANTPSDAATEAALNNDVGKAVLNKVNEQLAPLVKDVTNQVLMPPFDSAEDVHGAKLLDAAWAGTDRELNLMVKGGINQDGSPYGWGRVLTDSEVDQQNIAAQQDINNEFASLPLWDRIFSTKYSQSFTSQFAFAAPTAINTPFQFIASILSPTTGMRFAFMNTPAAHAAITPTTNFFHIPQYGAGLDELANAPAGLDENTTGCTNDRTPLSINDSKAVNRGLGEAEFGSVNWCLADQEALETYSAWDSGQPLDPTAADASVSSGVAGGTTAATGSFIWPIAESDYQGDTACYGESRTDSNGITYTHTGIDLVGKAGEGQSQILAADGGLVISLSRDPSLSMGVSMTIKHSDTSYTSYAYMNSIDPNLKVGSSVGKGQVLGTMGNTGESQGAHLHFEVGSTPYSSINTRQNPLRVLPIKGAYQTNTHCPAP